jgi:hypothetical protein
MRIALFLCVLSLPAVGLAQSPVPASPVAAAQAPASVCRVLDAALSERYEGPCKDGLAHGRGKATGSGGSYEGDFAAGRRQGQGTLVYGPGSPWVGDRYVGGFKADKLHGEGTYTWAFGDQTQARFENGVQVAGATAYQHMRAVGIAQLATVLKEGSEICRVVYPPGSGANPATPIRLRGKFLGAAGDRALIELTDAPGVQPGARTWDIVTRWAPCGASVRRK